MDSRLVGFTWEWLERTSAGFAYSVAILILLSGMALDFFDVPYNWTPRAGGLLVLVMGLFIVLDPRARSAWWDHLHSHWDGVRFDHIDGSREADAAYRASVIATGQTEGLAVQDMTRRELWSAVSEKSVRWQRAQSAMLAKHFCLAAGALFATFGEFASNLLNCGAVARC